jgi:hypothetical protein
MTYLSGGRYADFDLVLQTSLMTFKRAQREVLGRLKGSWKRRTCRCHAGGCKDAKRFLACTRYCTLPHWLRLAWMLTLLSATFVQPAGTSVTGTWKADTVESNLAKQPMNLVPSCADFTTDNRVSTISNRYHVWNENLPATKNLCL